MLVRSRAAGRPHVSPATWLAWLLPVFAWAPLAYPGYFEFLNGFSPIFNLDDFLRHGASLAWLPSSGQPYDLLRGEGWLAYLLAAPLRSVGLPGVSAVKVVLGACMLAGALGTYGWARRRLGLWPGLLASAAYVFWPMGLATVYVRGAFADAVLLGLIPLACWAADAALVGKRLWACGGLALALAAAFWTQAGLALWFAAMLLAYLLIAPSGHPRAKPRTGALLAWLAGILAGILGLLPRLLGHGTESGTYVNFSDHFTYLYQLLQSGWGQAAGTTAPYDAMPLQLGLLACGLASIGVVLLLSGRGTGLGLRVAGEDRGTVETAPPQSLVWLHVALALAPVALCLTLAMPLWRALPFLQRTLTYPWQLLLLAGPWLAWLAGFGGLMLAAALPDTILARELAPDAGRAKSSATSAGLLDRRRSSDGPRTVPLFASLVVLVVLGVYGDLNPPSTPEFVPERPIAVFGDNQVALLSVEAAGTPGPGNAVTVRTRWQALRPLDQDYTVFIHAVGPDGTLWGQHDTMPKANKFPTSRWQPGVVVEDEYVVVLKPDAPAGGRYSYDLGLYEYQTGQRLAAGTGDKVTLDGK